MRFDWITALAAAIFVSIAVTLILALAWYVVFKLREGRRPATAAALRKQQQVEVVADDYRPNDVPADGESAQTPQQDEHRR